MKKSSVILLAAFSLFSAKSIGQQRCATDEMHREFIAQHPEAAALEQEINEGLRTHKFEQNKFKRTTGASDSFYYDIPVVVHVIHNYGAQDYLLDNDIYNLIARMNMNYAKLNADTATVIAPFQKYNCKANIRFHLVTKDPQGNATSGITRHFSYLGNGGDDFAKLDQWDPQSYYNIWFEQVIGKAVAGGTVLAYSVFPADAQSNPNPDGVICAAPFINDGSTIEHETGHYFNLYHPWNSSGQACGTAGACGDDEVDDTPPTIGHPDCGSANLYDTTCAHNYFKVYTDMHGLDSLVNYPDTTNVQNMMDYACELMFTKGQVQRMYAALESPVGHRNHLHDSASLQIVGVKDAAFHDVARPDLQPVPAFYCTTASNKMQYFIFPNKTLKFVNKTWRDTINSITFTFGSGASTPTSTTASPNFNTSVSNSFSQQGWVNIALSATGNNHSTDTTANFNSTVFVSDLNATNPHGYYEDFDPTATGSDVSHYPMFNYYNNEFKWQIGNVGMYDNYSMMYKGYDDRVNPLLNVYPQTGYPKGDFDDFFTVPFDLSSYSSGNCNLNFAYSGATRSSNSLDINDSMEISYSIDGTNWNVIRNLGKGSMFNKGTISYPYAPANVSDWSYMTIQVPVAARTNYTVFRFRYRPGMTHNPGSLVYWSKYSTGNNYFIDRLSFSPWPAEVALANVESNITIAPNPTKGNAYVIVNDNVNNNIHITVTDITSRVVFVTDAPLGSAPSRIEIPSSSISISGMYLIQTTTGGQTSTHKLIVN